MYKLDRLYDDIVKARGPLKKGGAADGSDYEKVWDAFNRYLTATHQKRQTLNVHNFCKVGWKVEEHQGKVRLRPHFQLAESFMRVFNVESKAHQCIGEKHLTQIEEFNFSKAAIRYSQSMTKDNMFMGLRAIVHQIGQAAGQAQVALDFEVGRLIIKDRDAQFVFNEEIYSQEGLEVPDDALRSAEYQPSCTFGAPSEDAKTLSLQGSNNPKSVKATPGGGWQDLELSPRSPTSTEARQKTGGTNASVASEDVGRHLAHVEALGRHISQMEADAAKAMAEKYLWEGHLDRCNDLEAKADDWKRAIAKDHSEQLKAQMLKDEGKRAQDRQDHLTHLSMHDFPCFREPADGDVRGYLHERRVNLKQDLDQQVEAKKKMKQVDIIRDRELELNNIEAGQFDTNNIKKAELAKKQFERATLAQSWDQDVRLKTVKKAIADHHKMPGKNNMLSGLVGNLAGPGSEAGGPSMGLPSPRGRLDTPGALSDRSSGALSSRSGASSARRKPIGAAASLALQREKLKSNPRR